MAASGFTPISLYYSTTASSVPLAANLANGELALNTADMKLYAKNSSGVVTLLASNASTTGVDSLSFGSTGLTPSSATTGAITVAGTLAVANGGTGVTTSTGSGSVVLSNSPTLVTPALGTPSSGTVTNLTGTASININGTVGATTPTTGAFTTLSTSSSVTLSGGTVNGVTYLNASKVVTSGSALTFDGTNLGIGTASPAYPLDILSNSNSTQRIQFKNSNAGSSAVSMVQIANDAGNALQVYQQSEAGGGGSVVQANGTGSLTLRTLPNQPVIFGVNNSEQMRLTSTGLGIGTSSPSKKLEVANSDALIYSVTVGRGGGADATNTVFGYQAKTGIYGQQLTAIGYQALNGTQASYNTAVGYQSSYSNSNGYYNTSVGYASLLTNADGANNVAIGSQALRANTASNNTAVGFQAGYSNTTGADNIALGYQTGYYITTGSYNVMLGDGIMNAVSSGVAASNTVAVGYQALRFNNANDNTAVGFGSAYANTTGASNTAIGRQALYSNTTASDSTAVGYQSLYTNTANKNTALGYQAGYTNSSGTNNTFIGNTAGNSVTTGSSNTFIGGGVANVSNGSGSAVTTGSKNTILGNYTGNQGSLDIRTLSNYVVLSDGDGNPRMFFDTNGIANLRSSMLEQMTISATAATGTINFDAVTQSVLYYTTNASGNFTMNVRGNSGTTLNNSMVTGQSLTVAFLCTNGSTAYYQSAMTIDGTSVTPKWQGGTAPTTGNASSIDSYVYTIIKTGSATYTVLASQTKFA